MGRRLAGQDPARIPDHRARQVSRADRKDGRHVTRSSKATRGRFHPVTYFHWEDPLQFNQVNASLSVSPIDQQGMKDRLHASLQYKTLNWDFQYLHNGADFYDMFGPVERSRRGEALIAAYN